MLDAGSFRPEPFLGIGRAGIGAAPAADCCGGADGLGIGGGGGPPAAGPALIGSIGIDFGIGGAFIALPLFILALACAFERLLFCICGPQCSFDCCDAEIIVLYLAFKARDLSHTAISMPNLARHRPFEVASGLDERLPHQRIRFRHGPGTARGGSPG